MRLTVGDARVGRRPIGIDRERLAIGRERCLELAARDLDVRALHELLHLGQPLGPRAARQRRRMRGLDREHDVVLLERQLRVAGGERRVGGAERRAKRRRRARHERVAERLRFGIARGGGRVILGEERVVAGFG